MEGIPRGVIANVLDCDVRISVVLLLLYIYIYIYIYVGEWRVLLVV